MTKTTLLQGLFAAIVCGLASFGAALVFLSANNWFGAGDIPALLIWTAPLAGLTFLGVAVSSFLPRNFLGLALRYLLALFGGSAAGFSWTVIVAIFLGAWLGAFSFPVIVCWMFGSVAGMVAGACLQQPRSWPMAVGLTGLALLGAGWVFSGVTKPPAQVIVYVKPGASHEEVERVWREVLGQPDPRGRGTSLKEGIMQVSAWGSSPGQEVLLVTFGPGCSLECQERVLEEVRSSPLVQRVERKPR